MSLPPKIETMSFFSMLIDLAGVTEGGRYLEKEKGIYTTSKGLTLLGGGPWSSK